MRIKFLCICLCAFYVPKAQFAKEWTTIYTESFNSENPNFTMAGYDNRYNVIPTTDIRLNNGRVEINHEKSRNSNVVCNIPVTMLKSMNPVQQIKTNIGFLKEAPQGYAGKSQTYATLNWQLANYLYSSSDYKMTFWYNSNGEYSFNCYKDQDYNKKLNLPEKQSGYLKKGIGLTNEIMIEMAMPAVRFYFNGKLADSMTITGADNDFRRILDIKIDAFPGVSLYAEDLSISCLQYKPTLTKGSLAQLFPVLMAARQSDIKFMPLFLEQKDYSKSSLQLSMPGSSGKVSWQEHSFYIPIKAGVKPESMIKSLYNSILPQAGKYNLVGKLEMIQEEEDGSPALEGNFYSKTNLNYEVVHIFYSYRNSGFVVQVVVR